MTTDELISMHKAAEQVVADMAILKDPTTTPNNRMRSTMLAGAIETLAVIHRDVLRAMLS
jgi:hypothetical protein